MQETEFLNFMNIKSKNTEVSRLKKKSLMQTALVIKYGSNQNDSVLNIKPYSTQLLSAASGEKYDIWGYGLTCSHKYYTGWEVGRCSRYAALILIVALLRE